MNTYIAQKITINGQTIAGPLKGINTIADAVNKIMEFVYPLAGILLFLYLVWGGYDFLLAQGNPEKVKSGKGKLTAALVGFILLVIAYILVKLIATIFGLDESGILQ